MQGIGQQYPAKVLILKRYIHGKPSNKPAG
jgi:hypothetical protein